MNSQTDQLLHYFSPCAYIKKKKNIQLFIITYRIDFDI